MTSRPSVATPIVSVIIPHFGTSAAWLHQAVQSIVAQTLTDIEIHVVDDSSPDDRWLDGVRPFAADRRLTVWRTSQRVGHYRIANRMLEIVRGRYVAFQDADDWSHPDRLRRQVDFIRARKAHFVGCSFIYVDEHGVALREKAMVKNVNLWIRLPRHFLLLHPTTLNDIAAMRELGGFDGTAFVAADDDFMLRAVHRHRIRNLTESLYFYRLHAAQLTQARDTGMGSIQRSTYTQEMLQRDRERWRYKRWWSRATPESLRARPNDMTFDLARLT